MSLYFPCLLHSAFARGQAVSCCFPVISDLPSEIEHCKIVQVDDGWDCNRTFYMLWSTFSCACQQPSSWKIGTELQAHGLRYSISFELTRLIKLIKPEKKVTKRIYLFLHVFRKGQIKDGQIFPDFKFLLCTLDNTIVNMERIMETTS